MKKFIYHTIFVSLFSIISTFGQKEDYSAFLIPPELTENANAIVRNNSIEITIEDVDKMVVNRREVVTVLNKLGNVDARISESYDNDTKVTNLSAIIYDASGKKIKKYREGDFLDVSAVSGGTLYSDARIKYVDYTPVSYPYTLVFESEYKTSSTGFIPGWFPTKGYYVGVQKSTYILHNPKEIEIRTKKLNFKEFGVKDISSNKNLQYVFENQAAIKPEALSIPSIEFMPFLKVAINNFTLKGVKGTASNWKEFGKWEHDFLLHGRDVLDETTISTIKNLVKGVENPIEKAKIVYQFMQNKTRYISVQVGIGGWEPIAANEVDKVGYGDCKGLTNYTKALLDVVGVTSYYTLVYAKQKRNIDKEFASFQGNHAILNIPNNGNDIWLECTSQIKPFGFLGDFTDDRNVLVVTPEGGVIKRTTSYKNETNVQTTKGVIQFDINGNLKASLQRVSKGLQYEDKFRIENYTQEELVKNYKSDVWSYNNNLEIEDVSLHNDKENIVFTEDIKAEINNYATINDSEFLFRVNVFNRNSFVPKRYRTRKLPLKIGRGYKDVDAFEIKIPEAYVLDMLPKEKEISTKFGNYKISFTKINDTTFRYEKTLLIKEGVYTKEDYNLYRNFRRSIAKYENLRIAIIKKKV
ncbi:DUF3857 domain-containing protein [Polaribacter sp.]|uniref:DUF3857 domain-containing protein n=1 Tax=Polaribacter sp. TaxID=1920175 RepID=UPI003EF21F22